MFAAMKVLTLHVLNDLFMLGSASQDYLSHSFFYSPVKLWPSIFIHVCALSADQWQCCRIISFPRRECLRGETSSHHSHLLVAPSPTWKQGLQMQSWNMLIWYTFCPFYPTSWFNMQGLSLWSFLKMIYLTVYLYLCLLLWHLNQGRLET